MISASHAPGKDAVLITRYGNNSGTPAFTCDVKSRAGVCGNLGKDGQAVPAGLKLHQDGGKLPYNYRVGACTQQVGEATSAAAAALKHNEVLPPDHLIKPDTSAIVKAVLV